MKQPLQDIELIERYFDNTLSPSETDHLKDRLKADNEFQKLFNREKLLIDAIRVEGSSRDLEFLKTIERSLSEKKESHDRIPWYYYAVAASVALIALALWNPFEKDSPEELFIAYYQPHPNIFDVTLRGASDNTAKAQAFQAYERKDYQHAAALFTELLKDNKDPGMLMLLGNSNLILGRTDLAKENFSILVRDFDDLDTAGKWYLALSYLKDDDPIRSTALLKDISDSASDYGTSARNLLKELE